MIECWEPNHFTTIWGWSRKRTLPSALIRTAIRGCFVAPQITCVLLMCSEVAVTQVIE